MPQIPRETTERILAATDIVDVIGSYKNGRPACRESEVRCVFHDDASPSFNINPARQVFHCFGCKKSGDAITFVREIETLTFDDALKTLADRAGIEIPKS